MHTQEANAAASSWSIGRYLFLSPFVVLLLGSLLALLLFQHLQQRNLELGLSNLRLKSEEQLDAIKSNLEASFNALHSLDAFYRSSQTVEQHEFSAFSQSQISRTSSFHELIRAEPILSKKSTQDYSAHYLFPTQSKFFTPGAKLSDLAPAQEAIEISGTTGHIGISSPFLSRAYGQEELLFFTALRGKKESLVNPEEKGSSGLFLGVFSFSKAVRSALSVFRQIGFVLRVRDKEQNYYWLVPDEAESSNQEADTLLHSKVISVGGRELLLQVYLPPGTPIPQNSPIPLLAAGSTLLLSALIAWYMYLLIKRSAEVHRLAKKQSDELHSVSAALKLEADRRIDIHQNLVESEQRFHEFAERFGGVFWIEEFGSSEVLYVSPSFEKVWGRDIREAYQECEIRRRWIHEEDRERVIRSYESSFQRGDYNEEYRIRRPNGEVRWIWERGFPIVGETGELLRMAGIVEDITEQKFAAEQIVELNRFLDSLFENLPNMLFVKEADELRFTHINKAAEELMGYSRNELLGRNDFDFFPAEQAEFFTSKDKEVLRSNELVSIEQEPIDTKHGKRILQTKKIPILNEQGRATHLLGISEDITERIRWEKERENAHLELERRVEERTAELTTANTELQRLAMIVESSADAIFSQDLEGRVTSWNRGAELIYGYSARDIVGKNGACLLCPSVEQIVSQPFASLSENVCETLHIRANGEKFNVSLNVSPIRSEGKLIGHCTIARDVSKRVTMEEELRSYRDHLETLVAERTSELVASRDQLSRSERMASIGALAAGIAHEINNPVGAIILTAENAMESLDNLGDSEQAIGTLKRTCNRIISNATRCAQIVKGVLQFSRQEETEKWETDLNSVIPSALKYLSELDLIDSSIVELDFSDESLPILANPIEIEQVLINLIRNSVDSRDNGLRISISTRLEQQEVILSVSDNGCGIPLDIRERVFDPFYTTRLQHGGTGLGLSIVHGIVTSHGGRVSIDSLEPSGTLVQIRLPLYQAPESEHTFSASNSS